MSLSSSAPTPPTPPDASVVAQVQQNYNEGAQRASMVDQSNPLGSLTWEQTGTGPNGVPTYTASVQMAPEELAILRNLQAAKTTGGAQAGELLAHAGYGGSSDSGVGDSASGIVADRLHSMEGYWNPIYDRQTDQLDAKLRNQGLSPGDPAYRAAMDNLSQSQNETKSQFIASAEPQAFQEAQTEYLNPLNIAMSELGFSQPDSPTGMFQQGAQMQPANFQGAIQNTFDAQMQAYNAQLAQQQAMMSGLFGIPSAVLGGWARSGFAGAGGLGGAGAAGGGGAATAEGLGTTMAVA